MIQGLQEQILQFCAPRDRLTIDDLKLKPEQYIRFKNYSKDQRQDLHDAFEHIILTTYKEEERGAAIKLRNYFMKLTIDKHNRIKEYDDTPAQQSFDSTSKYFKK